MPQTLFAIQSIEWIELVYYTHRHIIAHVAHNATSFCIHLMTIEATAHVYFVFVSLVNWMLLIIWKEKIGKSSSNTTAKNLQFTSTQNRIARPPSTLHCRLPSWLTPSLLAAAVIVYIQIHMKYALTKNANINVSTWANSNEMQIFHCNFRQTFRIRYKSKYKYIWIKLRVNIYR